MKMLCITELNLLRIRHDKNFGQYEVERRWKVCCESVLFANGIKVIRFFPPESPGLPKFRIECSHAYLGLYRTLVY